MYASFLDEAAIILGKPALHGVVDLFRASAEEWRRLAAVLLPDHIPPFAEARRLLWRRHEVFLTQGKAALAEMQAIDERLGAIRRSMVTDFPLTAQEAALLREQIAAQMMAIHDREAEAIGALSEAIW